MKNAMWNHKSSVRRLRMQLDHPIVSSDTKKMSGKLLILVLYDQTRTSKKSRISFTGIK